MKFEWHSKDELEQIAENLLRNYDEELLQKPKQIDVYDVIEKCLGVPYDWKYLTPNQSVLGLTTFSDGYIWVWDKPYYEEGDQPKKIFLEDGEIVIDATLTESDNRGRENFTVIHEVFHQLMHRYFFENKEVNYAHETTSELVNGKKKIETDLDRIEYEANTCAAAFLMPKKVVEKVYKEYEKTVNVKWLSKIDYIIMKMAPDFNVSETAMRYRLINLGLTK